MTLSVPSKAIFLSLAHEDSRKGARISARLQRLRLPGGVRDQLAKAGQGTFAGRPLLGRLFHYAIDECPGGHLEPKITNQLCEAERLMVLCSPAP